MLPETGRALTGVVIATVTNYEVTLQNLQKKNKEDFLILNVLYTHEQLLN